jgi:hypothetical protein
MAKWCGLSPDVDRTTCFAFVPDLPPFEEDGDERTMRAFSALARRPSPLPLCAADEPASKPRRTCGPVLRRGVHARLRTGVRQMVTGARDRCHPTAGMVCHLPSKQPCIRTQVGCRIFAVDAGAQLTVISKSAYFARTDS